jgi:hypothetical protein
MGFCASSIVVLHTAPSVRRADLFFFHARADEQINKKVGSAWSCAGAVCY